MVFPAGGPRLDAGRGTQPSAPSDWHIIWTESCSQQQRGFGNKNNRLVKKKPELTFQSMRLCKEPSIYVWRMDENHKIIPNLDIQDKK